MIISLWCRRVIALHQLNTVVYPIVLKLNGTFTDWFSISFYASLEICLVFQVDETLHCIICRDLEEPKVNRATRVQKEQR